MTVVIGLTGSIASGKSTIAEKIKEYGISIVDADMIAREVVEPGKDAYKKIVETFGRPILHDDGTINRPQLGKLIFNDQNQREQLNAIVHPAVRKEMLAQRDRIVQRGDEAVVLDIPLLFESNLIHFVEKILVVSVQQSIQLERLMDRNALTEEEAISRIASQIPVKEKESLADAVIHNNGTKEESYAQLADIFSQWSIDERSDK